MVPRNVNAKDMTKISAGRSNPNMYIFRNRNNVIAERNQAVAPVGAWVESGQDCLEHPTVLATLTEELHTEIRREKEENLYRFQEEVRLRVAQQAQVRKRQQLQKSYEMVEHERRILQQFRVSAQRVGPRKNLFPRTQGELATCSPNAQWVKANGNGGGDGDNRKGDRDIQQLSKVMRQVRLRLAACQTGSGEVMSDLPGGIWDVSPTKDKPAYSMTRAEEEASEEEEELGQEEEEDYDDVLLTGQHDCPIVQQRVPPYLRHKSVTFDSNPVCEGVYREPYPVGPGSSSLSDRTARVLWPWEDQEALKRERMSQFLMYRRLFMDIEREQVIEHERHKKHLRRIARIKAEKEHIRLEEERKLEKLQRLQEKKFEMAQREFLIMERLKVEKEEHKREIAMKKREIKDKETTRYIKALRAQMKERITQEKVTLPPLCCCGDSFWDTHPETCANNCVFYNNPKVYAQALQSALANCNLKEVGSAYHRASARRIASMHALSL